MAAAAHPPSKAERSVRAAEGDVECAARRRGIDLIARGGSPSAVVAAISHREFDATFDDQQYGAAALEFFSRPAAFTGRRTRPAAGHRLGPGVAVQGNILTSAEVLTATPAAFQRDPSRPLAERLLTALEAGAAEGGDRRCGVQTARSAYLVVARPHDDADRPAIRFIVRGQREGGSNPVTLLRAAVTNARR